jgi:hypothetical protein
MICPDFAIFSFEAGAGRNGEKEGEARLSPEARASREEVTT